VQPWQQMFGNQGEAANSLSAESLTQASGAVVWPDLSAGTTPAAGPQQPGLPVPGGNPASSSSVEESSPAQVGVPVYGQPGTQAAAPVYGQPPTLGAAPVYGQSYTQGAAPAYGQPSTEVAALTYGQDPTQAPGYGQPFAQAAAPGYGQYSTQAPVPTYGQPASQAGAPAYGQPSTQAAAPGYGQPSPVGPTAYDAPGYTSPQSGPVDAGLPLPAVAYSQDANNMVRLSGTLAVEPRFVIDNGR
jgi:nucleoporin NUP42